MSETPHKLIEEFPDFGVQIGHLKQMASHFARICDEYTEVDQRIHLAEADIEPTDDRRMTEMRRTRMKLKDEIRGMLVHYEPEAERLG